MKKVIILSLLCVLVVKANPLFFLVGPATVAAPTTVSDDFNRADGAIGSNWTVINDSSYAVVASNVATTPTSAAYPNCIYASTFTFTANQFSRATMVRSNDTSGQAIELTVRGSGSSLATLSNYAVTISSAGWGMYKMVNGTELALSSGTDTGSDAFNTGDVCELRVIGTSITLYKNGTLLTTCTDSSVSTGKPGFNLVSNNSAAQAAIDNWVGGNL